MFYSQLLLSKKGALGIVWMAAHCHRRLKKEQVQQTDISSSVDKILDDEVPVVTHRILAFLLLGVVRIYSKKVEYLFHDCHEMLNKLHGLNKGKGVVLGVSERRYGLISLPKRFELDAFDLELTADQDSVGGNVRSHEKLILEDGGQKARRRNTSGSANKDNMLLLEGHSSDYTPPRDVLSPHQLDHHLLVGPSNDTNMFSVGKEIALGTSFFLEDRLDPMDLDEAEESNIRSHSILSLETIREARFSLEDCLDPTALDECDKELNDEPSNDIVTTNSWGPIQDVEFDPVPNPSPLLIDMTPSLGVVNKIGFSFGDSSKFATLSEDETGQGLDDHGVNEEVYPLNLQEDQSHEFIEPVDKFEPIIKKMKLLEVITTRNVRQPPEEFPLSIVTPELKLPGVATPEVVTLQTPGPKEGRKVRKKKKTLFDSTTKIPAEEFRRWISDPSELKREKKKVCASRLHAWSAYKLGISMIQGELIKSIKVSDGRDEAECSVHQEIVDVRSPVKENFPEQISIAPATPISCLNSLAAVADSDNVGRTNSLEIMEKSLSSCEGQELDAMFREETNSFDGDSMIKEGCSTRTRMTESYLDLQFMEKRRRKEEEVLNLSQLLAGKTKKENARLFYDILALKTRNSIDVQQENAYDDILVKRVSN